MESTTRTTMMRMRSFSRLDDSVGPESSEAVRPKKVLAPVDSTVASVSPRTTVEPILTESPLYMVTGRDSPVSAAWSTSTCPALRMQSAGTAPPEPRRTRSPGTRRAASMVMKRPSRLTCATGLSEAWACVCVGGGGGGGGMDRG